MLLKILLPAREGDVKQLNVSSLNRTCWLTQVNSKPAISVLVLQGKKKKHIVLRLLSWEIILHDTILKNFKCLLFVYRCDA